MLGRARAVLDHGLVDGRPVWARGWSRGVRDKAVPGPGRDAIGNLLPIQRRDHRSAHPQVVGEADRPSVVPEPAGVEAGKVHRDAGDAAARRAPVVLDYLHLVVAEPVVGEVDRPGQQVGDSNPWIGDEFEDDRSIRGRPRK